MSHGIPVHLDFHLLKGSPRSPTSECPLQWAVDLFTNRPISRELTSLGGFGYLENANFTPASHPLTKCIYMYNVLKKCTHNSLKNHGTHIPIPFQCFSCSYLASVGSLPFFEVWKTLIFYNSNPSLPKLLIVHKVYGVYLQDI